MRWKITLTCLLVAGGGILSTRAQSADALIDKLVNKGVLTVKEANELKEEADRNFTQAYATKTGLPEWVNSVKFSGDVRLRTEGFFSDGDFITSGVTNNYDRWRYRYRLRFGATINMLDNLEAGFRFTSSEPGRSDSTFGGDPISGNTSFNNNGSKKFLYVDQAYGRWYALNTPSWSSVLTIGKADNPFVFSSMVFDADYTPEGASIQGSYLLTDSQALKWNLGGFVLDELEFSSQDPFLLGAQVRWDGTWTKRLASTMGLAFLSINNSSSLTNGAVPNQNVGNSRGTFATDPTGHLLYHFNPIITDAGLTYTMDSFPLYRGPFPVKLAGEYMVNPAAPDSADNTGWNVGITFGKSGKRGMWELGYTYRSLGANSWYEEFVESDFGALYYRGPTGMSGSAGNFSGYGSGTNVRGHVVNASYSPTDSLTFRVQWFLTHLIETFEGAPNAAMNRLQIDGTLKF